MRDADTQDLARAVIAAARARGFMLATAESCTGGLIAAALTAIPGSSAAFGAGFVVYSNAAKTRLIGVSAELIVRHGAVSKEVARAMAEGALAAAPADGAVAVTGIAGPDGGSTEKPVGLVHIASAARDGVLRDERHVFSGDREAVRAQTVVAALKLLQATLRP